jgi:hypothetical protein
VLAALARPRRVDEAAEAGDVPVELAQRMLDVLAALGITQRRQDRCVTVDRLRSKLTDAGVEQLRPELRTTLRHSRNLVDHATRPTLTAGWVHTDPSLSTGSAPRGWAAARMTPKCRFAPSVAPGTRSWEGDPSDVDPSADIADRYASIARGTTRFPGECEPAHGEFGSNFPGGPVGWLPTG